MPFPQGHALIIGIGNYLYSPQHDVPATAADARAVAEIVRDPAFCGYPLEQITLLSAAEATRDGFLAGLAALAQTGPDDTVLLFYSGHGEFAGDGSYVLTTHDTQWQNGRVVSGSAVGHAELLQYLQAIPAGRVLLIFNACHAGLLSPTLGDEPPPAGHPLPTQTAQALLATGSGRIVISACREHQKSYVGSGEQTLFARMLVEGLRGSGDVFNRGGYISAFDLYTHLYYALGEAIPREVPQHFRKIHGETQEPELTVLKGVGPFAVALYRGADTLGAFAGDHAPPQETGMREVSADRSRRALEAIVGTATVQGDNSGQNVGVNTGTINQNRLNIHNEAANQGAQGEFHGPVTFNQPHTNVEGDYVGGDKVAGDKINVEGSQGFVNRPSGSVSQHFGDTVSGDKNSGDISVGNVSGSGIAIGQGAQASVRQGGDTAAFARAFAEIYAAINARPADPDVDRDEITETVRDIQQEAQKGDQANEKKLARWMHNLAGMAEDIFDITVAALSGPPAAFAGVARKVAARAKQERQ